MDMVLGNNIKKENDDKSLLRMLDRGIDDMEEGRELPLEEAMKKISEIRNSRRSARA